MYRAPLKEIRFVLHQLVGDERLTRCPSLERILRGVR